jgi:hypothetical protein
MEYYAGKYPPYESRRGPLPRRVRLNGVTGFYELLGGCTPPSAHGTWVAAITALYLSTAVTPERRPS